MRAKINLHSALDIDQKEVIRTLRKFGIHAHYDGLGEYILWNDQADVPERGKWINIGKIGVDSGQVMIIDPCYIDSEWKQDNTNGDGTYREACKVTSKSVSENSGQLYYRLGHAGLAVVSSTAYGDGVYPVYARVEDARVQELKVIFGEEE